MWNTNSDRSSISVLVVEDEPLLRMDAVDLFEDAGFVVHACPNADLAIDYVRDHPEIAVLFTDVDMPGSMDGLALARAVHILLPSARILVASGRSRILPAEMPEDCLFFPKPYRHAAVVDAVCSISALAA
jgi:CheY-like chemotaxis protein